MNKVIPVIILFFFIGLFMFSIYSLTTTIYSLTTMQASEIKVEKYTEKLFDENTGKYSNITKYKEVPVYQYGVFDLRTTLTLLFFLGILGFLIMFFTIT